MILYLVLTFFIPSGAEPKLDIVTDELYDLIFLRRSLCSTSSHLAKDLVGFLMYPNCVLPLAGFHSLQHHVFS
jgi:hypothetical protein